jgi:beta-N-acetylhexosaminidase
MTLNSSAIGLLALVAQIGIPVQDGAGTDATVRQVSRAEIETSVLGEPLPFAPVLRDALRPEDLRWIERTAEALTLEEKVGQLVMAWIEGGRPSEGSARWRRARRLVEEERVGGFIVGVGSSYGTASWLNDLQSRSDVPLLVSADLEWGPGTRLRGATVLPINMALAAAGPSRYAYQAGRITALEARAAGIHMAFAPVADVNVNPENPVINTRAYGSDPAGVSDRVVAFIEGARSAGLMTVVKHFPGHGDTETDSHLALPVLDVDRFRLEDVELRPFRAAIQAGVDGVMTAHLAVPILDPQPSPRPATLSPPILTGLLRDDLGFGGLVITDALHMDGVKQQGRTGEVAVAAIAAGADILLIPPDEKEAIDAVVRAVRRGVLSEERLDRSVRRVLAAKALAGLNTERRVNVAALLTQVGRSDHEAWGRSAAERSLTLVRGVPRSLPLPFRDRSVLAVIYDDRRGHRAGGELEAAMAERGARVSAVRLSRSSDQADFDHARRLAGGSDVVIFASYSRALPWKGALGLPEPVAGLAAELASHGAPVISFGDPYLLRQLPDVPIYLLAWDREKVVQEAAVRALAGEIPITGRLPIDLPGGYRVGDGVVVPTLPGITTRR